ncbi:hypothetical protein [Streptomyces sp. NBC_01104]|uniref:hypothetical protein n=1 Tax=Streptomyces sp. NBC_01104 TaxID=2903750 RepID=UPI003870B2FC|nr:hypothetical protein OG450_26575 [Streptomyces sp. NBC_01104]
MGRPTEVPEALGTPKTNSNGDQRSWASASGTLVVDISEPAWGLPAAPADAGAPGASDDGDGDVDGDVGVDGDGDVDVTVSAPAPAPAPAPTAAPGPAQEQTEPPPDPAADPDLDPTPGPTPRAPEVAHTAPARKLATGRRGPADPVKSLMHRHRDLCERAVDPLEIAAGLEAHGVTDRTAARYRHRDVFSLAEELFARVPGVAGEPVGASFAPAHDIETRAAWSLRALLPGAACLASFIALRLTDGVLGGDARLAIGSGGALLAFLALALALRSGPLCADGRSSGAASLFGCWLLGYVLYGDALLHQVLSGGPEGPWDITPAPLLGLAVAVAPAAWCAHLFSVHAHRKLNGSRALEEFAAGVRPLLFAAVAFFLCVLGGLLYLAGLGIGGGGSAVGAAALGVLLLLARLLTVHGFPEPAATGLAAACAVEAAAPALVLAGRLPGLDAVARPVDALVAAGGTGAVPALACGAAALGLLTTATVALSRASAHTAA